MLPSWLCSWCFPQNVRLDWKVIDSYKHSSLFGLSVSDEGKSFITLTPDVDALKLYFSSPLTKWLDKPVACAINLS